MCLLHLLGDIKRIFHVMKGSIKDRSSKDLIEAEDIKKKRWQEYTEELNRKGLNDTDNRDDVVIHLEPDISDQCK